MKVKYDNYLSKRTGQTGFDHLIVIELGQEKALSAFVAGLVQRAPTDK